MPGKTIHGMASKRTGPATEYTIWAGMIQRCYNPKGRHFHRYGGRGIIVCDRWRKSFVDFFADMGPRPSTKYSLDRYPNNDGNYEPGNVRWATPEEQANNRRDNKHIEFEGRSLTLVELADELGFSKNIIERRVKDGCTTRESLARTWGTHAKPRVSKQTA